MAVRLTRPILVTVAVLAALSMLAAALHFYESEPMDDMRARADALPLPGSFVLVSETYSPGAMGLWGAVPHLQRVYHAPWPGLCDTLRDVGARVGAPTGLAPVPAQYREDSCNRGASVASGWRGWLRNYRHYEVRFTAWRPGFAKGVAFDTPRGFVALYPQRGPVLPDQKLTTPEDRARVDVELIAHRGW